MAQSQLGILDQLPDQHILDELPDQSDNKKESLLSIPKTWSEAGHRLLDVNYGRPNAPKLVGPENVKIPGVESAGKYLENKLVNSGNYYLGALGGLIGYGSSILADAPSPMNSGIKAGEGATGQLKERLANIAKQETESLTPDIVKKPLALPPSPTRNLELPPAKTENFNTLPGWHGSPTEVWKAGPSRPYGGMVESTNQPGMEAAIGNIAPQSWPRSPEGRFVPNWYLGNPNLPYELPSAINPEHGTNYPQPEKPIIDITPTKGENTYAKVKELAPGELSYNPLNLKEKLGIGTPSEITGELKVPNQELTPRKIINQIGNTFKTAMASIDLSFPLNQGKGLITQPEFWKNIPEMIKMYGSENFYKDAMQVIRERPNYYLWKDKLALTGPEFGKQEEAFLGNWLENLKTPGLPKTKLDPLQLYAAQVKGSDRAYSGMAAQVRSDVADKLLERVTKLNPGFSKEEAVDKVAKFVNTVSGRGSLGWAEKYADDLNIALFSPRFQMSRLTMLADPRFYLSQPKGLRLEALRASAGIAATWGLELKLLQAAGAKLTTDPTNTDWGKAVFGKTRMDPGAGFQQYIVAMARFMEGKTTSSTTGVTTPLNSGKYGKPTRMDVLFSSDAVRRGLLESKASPIVSLVNDFVKGKTADGQDVSLPREVTDRFKAMFVNDMYDLYKSDPELLGLGGLALFGERMQTYR